MRTFCVFIFRLGTRLQARLTLPAAFADKRYAGWWFDFVCDPFHRDVHFLLVLITEFVIRWWTANVVLLTRSFVYGYFADVIFGCCLDALYAVRCGPYVVVVALTTTFVARRCDDRCVAVRWVRFLGVLTDVVGALLADVPLQRFALGCDWFCGYAAFCCLCLAFPYAGEDVGGRHLPTTLPLPTFSSFPFSIFCNRSPLSRYVHHCAPGADGEELLKNRRARLRGIPQLPALHALLYISYSHPIATASFCPIVTPTFPQGQPG